MNEPLTRDQINVLVSRLRELGPSQLEGLSHDTLYRMRMGLPKASQNQLAPYEHQAFARETTADNPLMAFPISGAIPFYQAEKLIGNGARSEPSWDQLTRGYKGVGQGLWQAFQGGMRSIQGLPAGTGIGSSATALLESLRSYPQSSSTASRSRPLPTTRLASK